MPFTSKGKAPEICSWTWMDVLVTFHTRASVSHLMSKLGLGLTDNGKVCNVGEYWNNNLNLLREMLFFWTMFKN